ncbi:citryl-CoA lyase [Rhizobium sp. C4]|uniref:citryl-CoA lyase n=1 Tax=Rhizobium sp. C4 TaxID=1349800 RepID=UPI001E3B9E52|nr:citryl-CoA lyase [Rhizobium sp. C4]MCD2175171.1 citryl-CoA lyase [Rhizobium sp. C4]
MKADDTFTTDIGWSTANSITVFGMDFPSEILGSLNLGDMAFLELTGRVPDANESRMFNAMVVTLVEHGLTPSTLAARLTYLGAPEALQAAVAAGLSGLGSVFVGSVEGSAKMLYEAFAKDDSEPLSTIAARVVADFDARKQIIPGIGHPFHKPIDPRTPRLIQLAEETGFRRKHVDLVLQISATAEKKKGKELPVNATGILGALCCEMGFDWKICRGLGVMARAVGIVGHLLEESRNPIARKLWLETEERATRHLREATGNGTVEE